MIAMRRNSCMVALAAGLAGEDHGFQGHQLLFNEAGDQVLQHALLVGEIEVQVGVLARCSGPAPGTCGSKPITAQTPSRPAHRCVHSARAMALVGSPYQTR